MISFWKAREESLTRNLQITNGCIIAGICYTAQFSQAARCDRRDVRPFNLQYAVMPSYASNSIAAVSPRIDPGDDDVLAGTTVHDAVPAGY
jgi:hypothetical protein